MSRSAIEGIGWNVYVEITLRLQNVIEVMLLRLQNVINTRVVTPTPRQKIVERRASEEHDKGSLASLFR